MLSIACDVAARFEAGADRSVGGGRAQHPLDRQRSRSPAASAFGGTAMPILALKDRKKSRGPKVTDKRILKVCWISRPSRPRKGLRAGPALFWPRRSAPCIRPGSPLARARSTSTSYRRRAVQAAVRCRLWRSIVTRPDRGSALDRSMVAPQSRSWHGKLLLRDQAHHGG